VNSIVIALFSVLFLSAGYRFYGTLLERRVVQPNDEMPTPAVAQRDDVDFSPAATPVLFGHHFSSIAGAGPIMGPVLGVFFFGWAGVLGWILLGNVFAGAVHDYLALMMSVRNRGISVAEVARTVVSPRASAVFATFVWLTLTLVVCVFADSAAKTLVERPEMVIPTATITAAALLFGVVLRSGKVPLALATVGALAIVFFSIYVGLLQPVTLPLDKSAAQMAWFWILLVYCTIASVLPVWLLLQPRDYLAAFQLWAGLLLGFAGVLVAGRAVTAPAWTGFVSAKQGPMWPMLFILVACGAFSGFHSLVAGGTTSKQLSRESAGRIIGYGAMTTEGALAVLSLICVSAGLYWSGTQPAGTPSDYVFQEIMAGGAGGWLIAFANGFGRMLERLPWMTFTVGSMLGMLLLQTFITTTLDTATRLGRFVLQESVAGRLPPVRNRWIGTLGTVAAAALFKVSGSFTDIVKLFGTANQLIGGLALIVISVWLLSLRKPSVYAVGPAVFVLATTLGALLWQFYGLVTGEFQAVLVAVCGALIALAIYVLQEAIPVLRRQLRAAAREAAEAK
jgi:carbon starvation protein